MKSICKINSLKNICSYINILQVQRRQAEKEAEEQRKLDVELMEARRQQRKLNFLITQTELYAHFMAKKLGN
jgi:DNA helicase INO80